VLRAVLNADDEIDEHMMLTCFVATMPMALSGLVRYRLLLLRSGE
jgi:hypothetical protein